MKALRFHALGGPEVLVFEDAPEPRAGKGKVVVEVAAAGLNFADTVFIRGQYFLRPTLPDIPGMEAAGVVTEIGADVTSVAVGDRVIALAEAAFAERMISSAKATFPSRRTWISSARPRSGSRG